MSTVEPESFAIIVGIDRYQHLGTLEGPVKDASDFERWVVDKTREDHVKPQNVFRAFSSSDAHSWEPTQDTVDRHFLRLCEVGERKKSGGYVGRRLYVFMAGHGMAQTIEEASLLTANAREGDSEAHIPCRCYCDWLRMAAYFDEIVLFVDSCRTKFPDVAVRPFPRPTIHAEGSGKVKYLYGFAARYGQEALEEARGFFSQALLEGLQKGRRSDGSVTAASLKEFILNHPDLKNYEGIQDPEIVAPDEIVLARYKGEGRFRVRLDVRPAPAARARIRGSDIQPFEVAAAEDGIFDIEVPRGLYAVEVGSTKGLFEVSGTKREEKPIHVELR